MPTTATIGKSEQGRNITVTKFDVAAPLFRLYIESRIHGDEQESEDATGRLIADINSNPGSYSNISIHIVQVANPDGKNANNRYNANGLDLNREYESITTKEVSTIHHYIRTFRPHAVIDCHNFPPTQSYLTANNVAFSHDMLLDYPTSPMVRRTLTASQYTSLFNKIKADNPTYNYDRYINPDSVGRTRFSTEDIIDTRNGLAFRYDLLGFIFEGREPRADETAAVQEERTAAAQFGALKSTIAWLKLSANLPIIKNALSQPAVNSQYPLRSHYVTNTSYTMDMYHTDTHVVGPFTFTNFDTDDTNYVFTTCPLGYAVHIVNNSALVNHLSNNLGIPSRYGGVFDRYDIETIHIDAADAWDSAGGVLADQDPPANVAVTYVPSTKFGFLFYKLYFVSNTDGGYQLPFLLEPRSKYGLPRYRDLLNLPVVAGTDYSVLRLMKAKSARKIFCGRVSYH